MWALVPIALASATCIALAMAASALGAIAGGADGSVSWDWGQQAPNRGLNVELARIAPDGVPLGTINELNPDPEAPVEYPDQTENSHLRGIVVGPDGVTTAMWLEIVGWNARIVLQRVAADGSPLGEQITLASKQEIHIRPTIGIGPDGTVTVAWSRLASPGQELVARRISPDGIPEEGDLVLSEPKSTAGQPSMAMADDGTAVVAWRDSVGKEDQLLERRIAPDGTVEPTTHQLGTSQMGLGDPEVDVAPDGNALVLWEKWDTANHRELWVRHVAADGIPEPSSHLLDGPEQDLIPWSATLHGTSDGSGLVTWSDEAGEIQALPIAADGSPADTPIAIGSDGPKGGGPTAAAGPDGDLLFVWLASPCGLQDCVMARRMLADGSLGPTQPIDTGWLWSPGVSVGADGTATLLWSRLFARSPDRWVRMTRQLAPDGTLGPAYEVTHPGPEPIVAAQPEELGFGQVDLGSAAQGQLRVAVLSIAPIGTHSFTLAGPDSGEFSIESDTCSDSIAYPATCSIAVAFSPSKVGPSQAQLRLDAGEGKETIVVPLTGEGTGHLVVGKLKLNRSNGTATLQLIAPSPGSLSLTGPCLAAATTTPNQVVAGEVELQIASASHCRRQLRRTGSTSFGVTILFSPTTGHSSLQHQRIALRLRQSQKQYRRHG